VERAGLRIYALPGDEGRAARLAAATDRALAALERWYGPLRSRPAITIMEIPDGFGSQASLTGGIMLDARAFADERELPQLYHELSHLWNVPDRDTPSPRWNEGLATYLQHRLASELDGFTGTADAIERARLRVCGGVGRGDRVAAVPFAQYGVERMTDWSYRVGLLMFDALERKVGRDRLDQGLRTYMQRYKAGGGTTRELARSLDEASPEDLQPFFEEWLFSTAWTRTLCRPAVKIEAGP
jgi:aminopeptidase N